MDASNFQKLFWMSEWFSHDNWIYELHSVSHSLSFTIWMYECEPLKTWARRKRHQTLYNINKNINVTNNVFVSRFSRRIIQQYAVHSSPDIACGNTMGKPNLSRTPLILQFCLWNYKTHGCVYTIRHDYWCAIIHEL